MPFAKPRLRIARNKKELDAKFKTLYENSIYDVKLLMKAFP